MMWRDGGPVRSVMAGLLLGMIWAGGAVVAPVLAQDQDNGAAFCEEAACTVPYRTEIAGTMSAALRALLRDSSQLVTQEDKPPQSMAGLRRRAESDLERLEIALKSEGHYTGRVRYRVDETEQPVRVIVTAEPGPAYPIRRFAISYESPLPEAVTDAPRRGADVGLPNGRVARGPDIVAAQARAVARIRAQGFPFVSVAERRVMLDLQNEVVDITLRLNAGPRARFGKLDIAGLERVEAHFVTGYVPWTEGELYDPAKVSGFADALQRTALFQSVRVRIAETVAADGTLPVLAELQERAHRTIGFGLNYSTSEGAGGSIFWENRNLSREGESLRLELDVSTLRQSLVGRYEEPQFLRTDQTLIATTEVLSEDTDAFESQSVTTSLGVDRRLSPVMQIGVAVEAEYARTIDATTKTDSYLLALPVTLRWDTTDSPLNPKTGLRLTSVWAPATGFNDGGTLFFSTEVALSAYQSWGEKKRWVWANRLRFGTISGEDTDSIPAQRRFYAGGSGSLRGYAYQEAGPLDDDGTPLGGRSVVEAGTEFRVNITPAIGIAPFFEVGTVFDDPYPEFEQDLLTSTGVGLWYDTPVGPFRADIGIPLSRRRGVDNPVQFYVSLGQAF